MTKFWQNPRNCPSGRSYDLENLSVKRKIFLDSCVRGSKETSGEPREPKGARVGPRKPKKAQGGPREAKKPKEAHRGLWELMGARRSLWELVGAYGSS